MTKTMYQRKKERKEMKCFNSLANYIVSYEMREKILNDRLGGERTKVQTITGFEAINLIKGAKLNLSEKLNEATEYCFCWNKNGNKLIPIRMSMKRKTIANIEKGSRRYGSAHILMEVI